MAKPLPTEAAMTYPAGRSAAAAEWLLRLAVAALCGGVAAKVFLQLETSTTELLIMQWGWDEQRVLLGEWWAAVALLAAGVSVLLWPTWPVLLAIAAAILFDAWAAYTFGGFAFFEWTIAAHALRFVAPVALAVLVFRPRGLLRPRARWWVAGWMLRIAVAAVFITHGLEAWNLHPGFLDMLIGTPRRLLGVSIEQSTAEWVLRIIAVVDVAAALLVLVRAWRAVLLWMAFWGLVTAAARMTSLGWGAYYELLVRIVHVAAPLAVWLLVEAVRHDAAATSSAGGDESNATAAGRFDTHHATHPAAGSVS